MKTLFTTLSLLITLTQSLALASPFTKSCEDYNQSSVGLLDDLLTASSQQTNQEQGVLAAKFQGMTENGKACEVKISRILRAECGITSARYHVAITVDSLEPKERACAGALTMDVDLKVNSDERFEFKNTYVYPQFFSSDFDKIIGKSDSEGLDFECRSYIKDRPGYRVGHDRQNNCRIR